MSDYQKRLDELIHVLTERTDTEFYIFISPQIPLPQVSDHIHLFRTGDPSFMEILRQCHGIISTAGHTLLSEAMFLCIPVYCTPLYYYEQIYNAGVIEQGQFGLKRYHVTKSDLASFIERLPEFEQNIANDPNGRLQKGPEQQAFFERFDALIEVLETNPTPKVTNGIFDASKASGTQPQL